MVCCGLLQKRRRRVRLQAFAAVLRRPVAREMERLRAGWLLLLLRCCERRGAV